MGFNLDLTNIEVFKPLTAEEVRKKIVGARLKQFLRSIYGSAISFEGPNARIGDITTGERGSSVAICMDGEKAGTFMDHNAGGSVGRGDVFDIWRSRYGGSFEDALKGINDWAGGTPTRRVRDMNEAQHRRADTKRQHKKEFQTSYVYTDERGNELFTVKRFGLVYGDTNEPVLNSKGKQKKDFRVSSADGNQYPAGMELRPLYKLPEISSAGSSLVVVCEGEKAADALRALGYVATTMPGGSAAVNKCDWSSLASRDIIIWPDNDSAGLRCAEAISEAVGSISKSVMILPPYQSADGADAADMVADGMDVSEYINSSANLRTDWVDDAVGKLNIISPSDIEFTARDWVSEGALLSGAITLFAAPPGTGKTAWSMQLAATFSQGDPFSGTRPVKAGRVLMINAEEPLSEMARRLRAACQGHGYNFDQVSKSVQFISGYDNPLVLTKTSRESRAEIITDIRADAIAAYAKANNVDLVIMDPVSEFGVGEENDNNAQKQFYQVMRKMAADGEFALLAFAHTPKATGWAARGDMNMVRGAGSAVGVARFVFTMLRLPKDEAEEYGIDQSEAWRYTVLDLAKGNMIKGDHDGIWQKKNSIDLITPDGEIESMPHMVDVEIKESEPESEQSSDAKHFAERETIIDCLKLWAGSGIVDAPYKAMVDSVYSACLNKFQKITKAKVKALLDQLRPKAIGQGIGYPLDKGFVVFYSVKNGTSGPIVQVSTNPPEDIHMEYRRSWPF